MSRGAGGGEIVLSDGALRVAVARLGAELRSLQRVGAEPEYLWQGARAFWPRRSPVLFPIVGRLRDDAYSVAARRFHLPQHGFARDRVFEIVAHDASAASFELRDDEATREVFPFEFRLTLRYRLVGGVLELSYQVDNPAGTELLFSLGAHPGFNWPLAAGDRPEEYLVEFEHPETADRWRVERGLIGSRPEPLLRESTVLSLDPARFGRDALVFKNLISRRVRLVGGRSGRGVELSFPGFPYFALWSKPGAPFVCLEPWCGLADGVDAGSHFEEKEGIERVPAGGTWRRTLTLRPF